VEEADTWVELVETSVDTTSGVGAGADVSTVSESALVHPTSRITDKAVRHLLIRRTYIDSQKEW